LYIVGHRALWRMGICHRDISVANLTWDSTKKKGVLNNFHLARFANKIIPSDNSIIGTVPFLALDVLGSAISRNRDTPLYRHELESFTWVLIYLCYSVTKSEADGTFGLDVPEKITEWFPKAASNNWKDSFQLVCIGASKRDLYGSVLPMPGPTMTSAHVHRDLKILHLIRYLYSFWVHRYHTRQLAMMAYEAVKEGKDHDRLRRRLENLNLRPDPDKGEFLVPDPYKEMDEEVLWKMVIEDHCLILEGDRSVYIQGLMRAYLDTQWPEVIEKLRDT